MLTSIPRSLKIAAAALLAAGLAAPVGATEDIKPGGSEEKWSGELERGRQALARNDLRGALDAFKQADRMADGRSAEVLDGLAITYVRSGQVRDGVKAARRGVEAAKTPESQARLANCLGFVLYEKF